MRKMHILVNSNTTPCSASPATSTLMASNDPFGKARRSSTPDLLARGVISPMVVLRTLPESVFIQEIENKQHIDHIENQCSSKVLILSMESHNMIGH
eukprot:359863_1